MSKTIVYFGSGPVAARSLELLHHDFEIEAVITKPSQPHHKETPPVINLAEKLKLKILTASNKSDLEDIFLNNNFNSDIAILIDYGIIVPETIIDSFKFGIVNSHFSLLPALRGADPITSAIKLGLGETGVSLMLLSKGMDEGPLIASASIKIDHDIYEPELTNKLILLSHNLLKNYIAKYLAGKITPTPQPEQGVSYTRKLTKDDSILDFSSKTAQELEREIRAYITWPRSRTKIKDLSLVITAAHVIENSSNIIPGKLYIDNDHFFGFTTIQGILIVDKLIPAGKKEMDSKSFINGYKSMLKESTSDL